MRSINRATGTVLTAAALAAVLAASLGGCAAAPGAQAAHSTAAGPPPATKAAQAQAQAPVPAQAPDTTAMAVSPAVVPPANTDTAQLTPAAAAQLGQAGILTADDLPGYTPTPTTRGANGAGGGQDEITRQIVACLGLTPPHHLWSGSLTFTNGATKVDSAVDVADTIAGARSEIGAAGSEQAARCNQTVLARTFADAGAALTTASVQVLPVTVDGADWSFVQEFSYAGQTHGHPFRITGYNVGALIGQAEIDVAVFQTGAPSFRPGDAAALARTAACRARATQATTSTTPPQGT